jgi:hypothetical protein
MALIVGTNSYISVADAETYFADQLDSATWTAATADQKAKALIAATRNIDLQLIKGQKKLDTQKLEFPRKYYKSGYWLVEDTVPQSIINATCEEAQALLKPEDTREKRKAAGVKSVSIGDVSETYSDLAINKASNNMSLISPVARQFISGYIAKTVFIV